MKTRKFHACIIVAGFFMLVFTSCVSSKKLYYFTDVPEGNTTEIVDIPIENRIAVNDILHITILSQDEVTNKILNSGGTSQAPSASGAASAGAGSDYLVSDSGYINLAVIGSLKVTGMKKEQIADTIISIL